MKCLISTTLAFVLGHAVYTGSTTASESEVKVEKVFEVWRGRQDRLHSARFEIAETTVNIAGTLPGKSTSFQHGLIDPKSKSGASLSGPAEDSQYQAKRTVSFEQNRMRHSVEGIQWVPGVEEYLPRQYVRVFDGSVEKAFYGKAGDKVFPLGYVDEKTKVNSDADSRYLHPLLMNYRPFHPTMGRFPLEGWSVVGNGIVGNRNCAILELKSSTWKQQCWVDVEREYILLRYCTKSKSNQDVFQLDISYKPDVVHGWVPINWKAVSCYPESSAISESYTAVVDKYEINIPIELQDFQFEFPPGTLVRHYQKENMYIETGDSPRIITDEEMARHPSYDEILTSPSGMAGLNAGTWQKSVYWIGAALVVGIALYLLRRKIIYRAS
jgi:hypothetical protein